MTALTLDALVDAMAVAVKDASHTCSAQEGWEVLNKCLTTKVWNPCVCQRQARAALAALHRAAVSTEIAHHRTRALIGAAEVVMEESAGRQQDRSGIGLEYAYALRDVSDFLRALAEAAEGGT